MGVWVASERSEAVTPVATRDLRACGGVVARGLIVPGCGRRVCGASVVERCSETKQGPVVVRH